MPANQTKITVHFDRMTEAFGINKAAHLHRALLHGPITPEVRAQVRTIAVTPIQQPKQKVN